MRWSGFKPDFAWRAWLRTLDSRLRGNDGVEIRKGAERLRVFVRIRIYRIEWIFRISFRPSCVFRHNRKSRQSEYGQALA